MRLQPHRGQIVNPRVRGIYETEYGNACRVNGPKAKSAYDLDMDERIPIEMVTFKYLRSVDRWADFNDQ